MPEVSIEREARTDKQKKSGPLTVGTALAKARAWNTAEALRKHRAEKNKADLSLGPHQLPSPSKGIVKFCSEIVCELGIF